MGEGIIFNLGLPRPTAGWSRDGVGAVGAAQLLLPVVGGKGFHGNSSSSISRDLGGKLALKKSLSYFQGGG